MIIYLGADHAGFKLKEQIKKYLKDSGYKIFDLGAKKFVKTDDYPDYAYKVGKKVASSRGDFGVLFCGSGQGVCIAANKIKGVRAVAVLTAREAKLTREHNNANVLCLSGKLNFQIAKKIVKIWIETPFSGAERHLRRLRKIQKLETCLPSGDEI
jgi:ribose 5-phosphate isomerase B